MREINIKFNETQSKLSKSVESNASKLNALKNSGEFENNAELMNSIPPEVVEMLSKT